jgi:hypothetical protein
MYEHPYGRLNTPSLLIVLTLHSCIDNHKPTLSSEDAPGVARLKPEIPGSKTAFDLSFQDEGSDKYGYSGTRTTDDNQYVLYFDPARKAFILDKIDSMFNLNLTRTPDVTDPEILRQEFAQLDTAIKVDTMANKAAPATATAGKGPSKASAVKSIPLPKAAKDPPKTRKAPEKKKAVKPVELSLPAPPKPEPKRRAQTPDDEDADDDDDDGGLTIEYPDSGPNHRPTDFSPAFPTQMNIRRFSDFVRESEADDADAEFEEDEERDLDLEGFKLPSPMNQRLQNHPEVMEVDARGEEDDEEEQDDGGADLEADFEDDLENDLEAELENAFQQQGSGDTDAESEVSEED